MTEVIVAENTGFCKGVETAVNMAEKVYGEGVYILGELIHNESVVNKIKELGTTVVDNISEIPDGATVIIRSHGARRAIFSELEKRNIKVVDCTCPFVKNIHNIVDKYSLEGYTIVILGEEHHPEVIGIQGWCNGKSIVIDDIDKLETLDELNAYEKLCIVAQTTYSAVKFERFYNNFDKNICKSVEFFKTICYTTSKRQAEADKLSKNCDAMVVIGGQKSSNTKKLFDICKNNCKAVYSITSASEFDAKKFVKYKRVGIVAGASTPKRQAMEVFSKMEEVTEVKVLNEMEEAVAMLDSKQQKFRKGQKIVATISSATDDGLALYINNTKKEILLPKEELDCESYSKEEYAAKVGEEIEVLIVGLNPVQLSQKAIKKIAIEEKEIEEIKEGKIFTVTVDGVNKGGLTAKHGSYSVFIPSSQIRMGFVRDLDKYVGKTLRLKMEKIEATDRRKQIVASQRVILEAERAEKDAERAAMEDKFFSNVAVGDVVRGKVVRFAAFGAFVEVDGFDCLAHISDLSWTGVKAPSDVLELDKEYDFKVLKADRETKKVSIGFKQLQARPWDAVPSKYAVGDVLTGKIVRIVDFGVFVEIEPGVDGLVHISQISHEWLEKPTEGLKVGDVVDVKLIGIDYDKEKITLSIKALLPAPENTQRAPKDKAPNNESEGDFKPKKRAKRERTNDYDDEVREWKESDFSGASIAELINKN